MYSFLYPDSLTYLIVKVCVLILALVLWWATMSSPVA